MANYTFMCIIYFTLDSDIEYNSTQVISMYITWLSDSLS